MPQFVLIDHALQRVGGHHYEYAERILRVVRDRGYDVTLATHVDCQDDVRRLGWDVCPFFRDGLWRTHTRDPFQKACGFANAVLSRVIRLSARAERSWAAASLGKTGRMLSNVVRDRLDARRANRFAADFERLLAEEPLGAGDVVFVPNVMHAEIAGIAEALRRHPDCAADVHLVFHWTLSAWTTNVESPDEAIMRRRLRTLAKHAPPRVHLHTDTEELTNEYQRVSPLPVTTLPVPIDERVRTTRSPRADTTPTIVFLGDARTMKGFPLLPDVVRGLAGRDVRFVFQAFYARKWPDLESLHALKQLREMENVELLEQPLDSEAYYELIAAADVILLPYDAGIYRKQSSGIFTEALTAGKPVVAAAGTWMSRQLVPFAADHQERLQVDGRMAPLGERVLSAETPSAPVPAGTRAVLIRIERSKAAQADRSARAEVRLLDAQGEVMRRIEVEHDRDAVAIESTLVPVEDAVVRIAVEFDHRAASSTVTTTFVEMNGPRSSVGSTWHPEFEPLVSAVREVLDHLPHYSETAGTLGPEWSDQHTAERLVERLLDSGTEVVEPRRRLAS